MTVDAGERAGPAPESVTATAEDSPQQHVRAALELRLRAMLRHEAGTRSGEDPEDLHQMRVSVRRMRAVLRAARPMLARWWADELRTELGWLGRALGPVRDLDVLLMRLREVASQFGTGQRADAERLFSALQEERAAARSVLLQALASERYAALVERLERAVAEPVPAAARDRQVTLVSLVRKEFDRLGAAVAAAGDQPADEVLHALRIDGKRLRYTAELAAPVLGEQARELLRACAAMQDVLGDHQDACFAQQQVTALLAGVGSAATIGVAFVAGRLFEWEEVRRTETRAAWPAAWAQVRLAAERTLA